MRLLISDPLFYIIGYWYGDAAVAWVEKRSSSFGGMLRTWERGFKKAAWPLVAIAPNNFICLFAGAAGMAPAIFITLNVVGTILRLWLIRIFGKAFESPIDDLLGWIQEYRWPLTAITAALVVVTLVTDRRSGKGEIDALTHIEDELGTEEHPARAPVGPTRGPHRRRRRRRAGMSRGTAVVTGASSGIGAATAAALAAAGFDVVVGARRLDRLQEVAEPLGARALPLDVTDDESVAAFAAEVPTCDVLVNNAGGALGLDPDRGRRPRAVAVDVRHQRPRLAARDPGAAPRPAGRRRRPGRRHRLDRRLRDLRGRRRLQRGQVRPSAPSPKRCARSCSPSPSG